jgi:hypothetical protein
MYLYYVLFIAINICGIDCKKNVRPADDTLTFRNADWTGTK